jgi:hypothetical protein
MNKLATAILSLAIFAISTTSAVSQEDNKPNYNFVGLEYVYNRLEAASDNGPDGNIYLNESYAAEASYALFDRMLFRGYHYDGQGNIDNNNDMSLESTEIGFSALNVDDDNVGIDGGILWRQDKFGKDAPDNDLKGFGLGFGLRANIAEKHEVGARFGVYFGDFDDSVGINFKYAWHFAEQFDITAGYEYMDVSLKDLDPDDEGFDYTNNKITLGGRFYF